MAVDSPDNNFTLPDRRGDMTGSEFAGTLMNMPPGAARELAIYQQFELGNIPDFMRASKRLSITSGSHCLEVDVLPDVLCVGTDDDFIRVPLTPMTAQRIADMFSATLITPFLSDQVWRQADLRIDPTHVTMPPTAEMSSTQWFVEQNAKIELARAGRAGLIAGHKKDVVLTNALLLPEFPDRVAIYGWHLLNGKPIQGLNPSKGFDPKHTHTRAYLDYSHGIRLASQVVFVDGGERDWLEVVVNEELSMMANGDAGPLLFTRYPTA